GADALPMLHASASRSTKGAIHVSLVNLDPNRQLALSVTPLAGAVSGRVLTAPTMNAHNTFERPTAVEPAPFTEFSARDSALDVRLPARSIVVLAIE
ncbi:MAG TPA: alpha-L-arabinofuranosidase C-terminal domain-containing protein, partial [Polyangiaceae bacterium]